MSEQVKSISREMSNGKTTIILSVNKEMISNDQEIEGFDELMSIYMNIKKCSDLINSIFGLQITIYLMASSFFYIMNLYNLVSISIHGLFTTPILIVFIIRTAVLQTALFSLCRNAQKAKNSVDELRRHLGKQLIHSISSDVKNYKIIKEFLHLLSNRPIRVQAFGSIDVDMTLIPKFVVFFTSYTVIALQFNNVI